MLHQCNMAGTICKDMAVKIFNFECVFSLILNYVLTNLRNLATLLSFIASEES